MLMLRFPLKRLIAALLPISFLWLFVACASICARESTEKYANHAGSLSTKITDGTDCEGCPIASSPKATIPERAAFKFNLQTPRVIPPSILSANSLAHGVTFVRRYHQPSFTDLPLNRLPLLRI